MLFEYMDLQIESINVDDENHLLELYCNYRGMEKTEVIFKGYNQQEMVSLDDLIGKTIWVIKRVEIDENIAFVIVLRDDNRQVPVMADSVRKIVK